jgi:trehalose/maltose transport system substrate-binding protein
MRRPFLSGLCLAASLLVYPAAAKAVTVTIACAAVGIEYQLCRDGAEAWAAKSGHSVELVQTPNSASERLALFQQLLAAESADIDVLQIDVIWPGTLGRYFVDLRQYIQKEERARHFPAMLANNVVDGELKAMPWYGDAGLLYLRQDLLDKHGQTVPVTWRALAETARAIVAAERAAGDDKIVGYVFQGRAYEGLTCNALEWVASFGAPGLLAADGAPALDRPEAVAAIDAAAGWVGDIAPRGVLNYAEEEARGVFQAGGAVFMRNWPYAWALLNGEDSPVRGKVAIARLPRGNEDGRHAGALGGGGLAVSRFSTHPDIAADLVAYLTGPAEQLRRARVGSFNPTRPALYENPDLRAANPFMAELLDVLTGAVARPSAVAGSRYNQLSAIFWNAVHDTLSGRGDAAGNLAAANRRAARLRRGGRW